MRSSGHGLRVLTSLWDMSLNSPVPRAGLCSVSVSQLSQCHCQCPKATPRITNAPGLTRIKCAKGKVMAGSWQEQMDQLGAIRSTPLQYLMSQTHLHSVLSWCWTYWAVTDLRYLSMYYFDFKQNLFKCYNGFFLFNF